MDQAERGIVVLDKASKADPGNANIRYHLAKALLKAGSWERAKDELRAVSSSTNDPQMQAEAKQLLEQLE